MPKPKFPMPEAEAVQTSAPADPRAGALRRTFDLNPSSNEAAPRKNAQRRTEPGHALDPAPTDHSEE